MTHTVSETGRCGKCSGIKEDPVPEYSKASKIENYCVESPTALFDVDGTLVTYSDAPREKMIELLKSMKRAGWTVRVHSGGGKDYAATWTRRLKIQDFVDSCHSKTERVVADISFDDERVNFCPVNVKV
jgi:predicted HAD superfamily phosphohydrolase YqeG